MVSDFNGSIGSRTQSIVKENLPLLREHLRDAEQNNTDASKPVAHHFNLPNHSHHNMTISDVIHASGKIVLFRRELNCLSMT